jgi:hypothetical protein
MGLLLKLPLDVTAPAAGYHLQVSYYAFKHFLNLRLVKMLVRVLICTYRLLFYVVMDIQFVYVVIPYFLNAGEIHKKYLPQFLTYLLTYLLTYSMEQRPS